jgi:hypothetical protein
VRAVIAELPADDLFAYFTGARRLKVPEGTRLVSFWIDNGALCLRLEGPGFPAYDPAGRIRRVRPRLRARP